MLDFPLILRVKLPVVGRVQPQSNKFATGMRRAIAASKLNGSPDNVLLSVTDWRLELENLSFIPDY